MSDADKLKELGIENVSNAAPGSNPLPKSFNNTATAGSNMMFEPDAELVEIPSHGYLYKNVTSDPDILERGSLRIRPMTVHEEKILTTARLVRSGQALDLIFRNCIKSDIDPGELLSSDRIYVMLWLRSISYGNVYKFWIQSQDPSNPGRFQWEVDLSTHPVKEFIEKDIVEPFNVELPSGYKIWFRLPRGKDELEIIKMQNQPKGADETDDTIVKRLSSIIIKAERKTGEEIPPNMYDAFVNSLVARDASAFRNKIDEIDCGIEDITVTDPTTGYEFSSSIPITEDFFRVTE
jgi:hypothetical protein